MRLLWRMKEPWKRLTQPCFMISIPCPWNTRDDVVLSGEGCNVPNFDLTLMGISPISYDVTLTFYLVYWAQDPNAHEHDDFFDILGIIQIHMFYVYDFMCCVWTLEHIIDQIFVLMGRSKAHEYLMFCVEQEALKHMSIWYFLLIKKLWNTWVFNVCVEWEALERMSILNVCLEWEALKHMKR